MATLSTLDSSGNPTATTAQQVIDIRTGLGLENVNNTSDANKPISTATATALAGKASTAVFSGGASGLVPATTSNTTAFLRADGAFAVPAGTGGAGTLPGTNGTITSGTAVVISLAANGITGPFLLNVTPASGCAIRVETSRDGGTTYTQFGATSITTPLSVTYSKDPTDSGYATHVRLTRTAGTLATTTYEIFAGVIAFTGRQNDLVGVMQSKNVVVDSTTRQANIDPIADRGYLLLQGVGVIDNQVLFIRPQATAPWDYTNGSVFFAVMRQDSGFVAVNPTASSSVVINNPTGLELAIGGPPLVFWSPAPDLWYVM